MSSQEMSEWRSACGCDAETSKLKHLMQEIVQKPAVASRFVGRFLAFDFAQQHFGSVTSNSTGFFSAVTDATT